MIAFVLERGSHLFFRQAVRVCRNASTTSRDPDTYGAAGRKRVDVANANVAQFDQFIDAGIVQAAPFGGTYA